MRYPLNAADGIPGIFRVPVRVEREGILVLDVRWKGRSLVNLKLLDAEGSVVARKTGSSPLEIRLRIKERPSAPLEWNLRFAPTITRGDLRGEVRVSTLPLGNEGLSTADLAALSQRAAPRPSAMRFEGPGRCLSAGAGDDAPGRALEALSSALTGASPEARAWTARWARRLADLKREEDQAGALERTRIDRLWGRLKLDPPVDEPCASAVRSLLASLELLSRDEAAGDSIEGLRAIKRRREVLGALECVAEAR